ncbi:hypothetical protein [Burkholderia cepacia]|uniref:hypothetical protein n=1 Tax=Burkholderia cepacia TaxID=292 RepID=UPI001575CD59|nr:hypothetical protein [Burkholderia cepacia]
MKKLIVGGMLIFSAATCYAELNVDAPSTTYFTGAKFMALNPDAQAMYLQGVLDGIDASPTVYGGQDAPMRRAIYRCEERQHFTARQLWIYVNDYLRDGPPAQLRMSMGILTFKAMMRVCRTFGTPID